MSAQQWAERIQAVVQAAEADGYDVEIVDDESCTCQRIEVRVSRTDADAALILEWNA
ncbi:hypothetical protein [Streptomyces sp. NPDC000878]